MKIDFNKIKAISNDFKNKHRCSNYEHNNPTTDTIKAFVMDILSCVSESENEKNN